MQTTLVVQLIGAAVTIALLLVSRPAFAGPPFITDDPEPVDYGHWEVYGFSMATETHDDIGGTLAGVEVNYGAAPNLQLHMIAPLAFDSPNGGGTQIGAGDIELGAKYRFVDPEPDDWFPQIGVFPLVEVPTGDAQSGLGSGHLREFLPVWIQKDFGKWTTYGGGGYWITPARAIKVIGSRVGSCNVRSQTTSHWAASYFIKRPAQSAARTHRDSTSAAYTILLSIIIYFSPRVAGYRTCQLAMSFHIISVFNGRINR